MEAAEAGTLRERILERALELFNERGIEYVGVRELARDLGIKGGNITYHFPTKDDLVVAIGLELRKLNDATIRLPSEPSLEGFLEMLRQAFQNHHRFRCLFLSLPKLLLQNEALAAAYLPTKEAERRSVLLNYLERLQDSGLLRRNVTSEERRRIVSFCALLTRGWIGDGRVSFPDATPQWQMDHYLHLLVDHLTDFAALRGRAELRRFRGTLSGRWDDPGRTGHEDKGVERSTPLG
jgi:AcrR family transcriptional regulator